MIWWVQLIVGRNTPCETSSWRISSWWCIAMCVCTGTEWNEFMRSGIPSENDCCIAFDRKSKLWCALKIDERFLRRANEIQNAVNHEPIRTKQKNALHSREVSEIISNWVPLSTLSAYGAPADCEICPCRYGTELVTYEDPYGILCRAKTRFFFSPPWCSFCIHLRVLLFSTISRTVRTIAYLPTVVLVWCGAQQLLQEPCARAFVMKLLTVISGFSV